MKNIFFDIAYLIKNKKEWLATIVVAIAVMIGLAFSGEAGLNMFSNIGSVLESIAVLATLFIASSVLREERLKNLDKKLTVIFEYKKKRVMVCEKAYLAGESDIRQWGQSIGQLMNHGARLHFEPFIQETDTVMEENGKQYKHYTALFTLEDLPEAFVAHYQNGQYLIWRCAIKNDSKTVDVGFHDPSVRQQT
jgi:hypothetical protein